MAADTSAGALPARLAATVMLLRGGAEDLEVLLIKRHLRSDVHGGVHVFPGGKVDVADTDLARQRFGTAHGLQRGFGREDMLAGQSATLYAAALRELQEECGIAVTDVTTVHPHSRWITPEPSPKRFDTWFFVALLPEGAEPVVDNHEAVEYVWLRPRAALQAFWSGHIQLAPPQIMSLVALGRHTSALAVLDGARKARPPLVQPEHIGDLGERAIALPGDEAHSVSTRALPGPSRLVFRHGRFEPLDGFDAFFA